MKKSEVGSFINQGLSKEEIKKRIKTFPENPTVEYLENLGYTTNTAKIYLRKLKINTQQKKTKVTSSNNAEVFIKSPKAQTKKVIIDTCTVAFDKCIDVIEAADSVTVLYCVIREFGNLKKNEEKSVELKYKIRILEDTLLKTFNGKYHLVPYRYKDAREADDIIIDYLLELPANERPTLVTADKNLALKAKCLGFEFIYYIVSSIEDPVESRSLEDAKKEKISKAEKAKTNVVQNEASNVMMNAEQGEIPNATQGEVPNVAQDKVPNAKQNVKPKLVQNETSRATVKSNVLSSEVDEKYTKETHLGVAIKATETEVEFCKYNRKVDIFAFDGNDCQDVSFKEVIKKPRSIALVNRTKKAIQIKKLTFVGKCEFIVKEFKCQFVNDIYELEDDFPEMVITDIKNLL